MNIQEEITIKVPLEIAQNYQKITKDEQEKIQLKLVEMMEVELERYRKEAVNKLRVTMKRISNKAQARGLTPEILAD